tara:strand:- start:611 stop:1168 length:558 start_codon:yes stop_codon:yes gene_type:complete
MNDLQLFSDRLKLRLIQFSDLDAIHVLHSIPEVDKYNTLGIPNSIEVTEQIIVPQISAHKQEEIVTYSFAIEELNTGKFIGMFGLKLGAKKYNNAEIWYKLNISYWNKGYGTEAVNRILDFGFDTLQLHRISAGCAIENIGSIKVLEKAGMIREGHARKTLPLKSGWSDNYEYAILETDKRKSLK